MGKGVQRVRKYQKNPGVGVREAKKAHQHPRKRSKGAQRVRKYQKNPGVGVGEAKKAQQHPQKRN